MEYIVKFIKEKISDTTEIHATDTNIKWTVFKIQKYHGSFEVYFCGCFFGYFAKEDVCALLNLYRKGNER